VEGIFQSGSEMAVRAVGSLAGSGVGAGFLIADLCKSLAEDEAADGSTAPRPELTLISS